VAAVRSLPTRVDSDSPAWERMVRGAPAGRVRDSAVVTFPGISWTTPRTLIVENALPSGADLGVGVAGRPVLWARLPPGGAAAWPLGREPQQGLRVRLLARDGGELRLRALAVSPEPTLLWWCVGAAAASGATAALIATRQGALVLPLVLWLAGVVAVCVTPMRLWVALPAAGALWRLAVPLALLATATGAAVRGRRLRSLALPALLIASAGFGLTARGYFISSAGSWDVEYWKAITARVVDHGITRAYGDPDSVPPGSLLAQMKGEEPAWTLRTSSQDFVVDPPPLMMVLWRLSHALVDALPLDLPPDAASNVAAKLPGVVGDVLATALLAVAFPGRRRTGLILAAIYWAWPISWWSSAVLGFFDGAYAPLVLAALLAAAAGHARACGALVALGALIKATALLAAPAIAISLWRAGGSLARAVAAGLLTVAAFLVPFVAGGTLQTAVVHVYRVLCQERLSGGFANAWWLRGHLRSHRVRGHRAHRVPLARSLAGGCCEHLPGRRDDRARLRHGGDRGPLQSPPRRVPVAPRDWAQLAATACARRGARLLLFLESRRDGRVGPLLRARPRVDRGVDPGWSGVQDGTGVRRHIASGRRSTGTVRDAHEGSAGGASESPCRDRTGQTGLTPRPSRDQVRR